LTYRFWISRTTLGGGRADNYDLETEAGCKEFPLWAFTPQQRRFTATPVGALGTENHFLAERSLNEN